MPMRLKLQNGYLTYEDSELVESLKDEGYDDFAWAVLLGKGEINQTSEKDKEILMSLKKTLNNLEVNAESRCSGASNQDKFTFCTKSSFSSEKIHVSVEGVGDVQFPLELGTVEKLCMISSKAKFGKGAETLLDLNVRDTQMIPASNLKVDIDDVTLSNLVQEIGAGLNIDSTCTLHPHLYNLLIYGPQQFFRRHTDTEKIENMIATLVVVLPSSYKGGELVIQHGREKYTFVTLEEPKEINWLAFYPDCQHWIEKVEEGFRVVLTYNIEMKTPSDVAERFPIETPINSDLDNSVFKFFDGTNRPKKLIYLFNHSYSENGLKWHLLKGSDRIQGYALYQVARNQNLVPCLALVVDEEFVISQFQADSEEKIISSVKISYIKVPDEEKVLETPAFPLEYGHDREICYTIRSLHLWKEFEEYREGFNGNEASKRQYRYHRACLILCDESLIQTSAANGKLKSLTHEITDTVNKLSNIELELEEGQQGESHKILVQGTLSSSQVSVSVEGEGKLSFPPNESQMKKLVRMSRDENRQQPHVLLPDQVNVNIENQAWSEMLTTISSGLKINSRCKLVPKLLSLRMYKPRNRCGGGITFCDLGHEKADWGDIKRERGDITLVVIFPGLTHGEIFIINQDKSCTHSINDDHELKVNYIAVFSESYLSLRKHEGTCLYLLYDLDLQSDLGMDHEIDISTINESLNDAVKKYFSDDIQPKKLIYLLNHDYSKNKVRWHMLKGSDEVVANAFYAVAKRQNLVSYLAFTEIEEYRRDAFSSKVTENAVGSIVTESHVKFIILVDENNMEIKPSSDQILVVSEGEVCFTVTNKKQSKPFKIDKTYITENVCYYNRACVVLFTK